MKDSDTTAPKQAVKKAGTRGILHPKMREKMIKPGEVRNPTGRPKGHSLTTIVKNIGREAPPDNLKKYGDTWFEVIARNAYALALKQHPYFKSILDLERESSELLNEFLDIVHRNQITIEDIKGDPVLLEAAIRSGYIRDGAGEDGAAGAAKESSQS